MTIKRGKDEDAKYDCIWLDPYPDNLPRRKVKNFDGEDIASSEAESDYKLSSDSDEESGSEDDKDQDSEESSGAQP